MITATLLDSHFKNLRCLLKDKRTDVWQELQVLLENSGLLENDQHTPEKSLQKKIQMLELSSDSEDKPLITLSSFMKTTVDKYRFEQQTDNDLNSLQCRKLQEDKYPNLTKVARKCHYCPM